MKVASIELVPWPHVYVTEVVITFDDDHWLRLHYNEDTRQLWHLSFGHKSDGVGGPYYLFGSRCLTPGIHWWTQHRVGQHIQALMDTVNHPFESIPLTGDRTLLPHLIEIVTPVGDHSEAFLQNRVPLCR